MPERKSESGEQRQQRIQREQHRPEQDRGYDEAVRGGSGVAHERSVPVSVEKSEPADVDDREAERARQEVRDRDRSANRPISREP
jgi:hypothetical protein